MAALNFVIGVGIRLARGAARRRRRRRRDRDNDHDYYDDELYGAAAGAGASAAPIPLGSIANQKELQLRLVEVGKPTVEFREFKRCLVNALASRLRRELRREIRTRTRRRTGTLLRSVRVRRRSTRGGSVRLFTDFPKTDFALQRRPSSRSPNADRIFRSAKRGQYAYVVNSKRQFIEAATASTYADLPTIAAQCAQRTFFRRRTS
ncbi:MAG: hypothetical protein OXU75_03165 [Deltaproteobacteria bacterium]|nr:hypothetical protein [Deltaproteobacteria bacterium]